MHHYLADDREHLGQGQATWGSRALWCPRDILKVPSFKYPSSQKIYFTKKFKNFWKNILRISVLLRNFALKLSSLCTTTYFCECVFSKCRSNLTDDNLRTANSTYVPSYNALAANLQCQPSQENEM